MKRNSFLLMICAFLLLSCNNKDQENETAITKSEINGAVQKGPFLNGTSVDIYELDDALTPTGKSFSTQIMDNSGLFQLNNVSLVSKYIQLKADGYYFNEITGQNSNSPIILYALTDISEKTSVNVNILSHLEKSRVEYLIKTEDKSFVEARTQADQEVLKIFSIQKNDIEDFDMLDISEDGDNNAILLAISLITQGYRTESELSDLLANITTDIRQDGELNSSALGSLLINDARLFNLSQIREDLENRYLDMGMTIIIPNFEKYINTFIDSTEYEITNNIEYPEFSNYGENILFGDKISFGSDLSLAAVLPRGTSLKIVIKGGIWYYEVMPDGPLNWTISDYENAKQSFVATETGKNCDLKIQFESGIDTIEYFENNSTLPTKIKIFQN
jgi:hypothetical protein